VKPEIRNPKSEMPGWDALQRRPATLDSCERHTPAGVAEGACSLGISDFGLPSDFGFQISDFRAI
jgi:hypothetical protein